MKLPEYRDDVLGKRCPGDNLCGNILNQLEYMAGLDGKPSEK